MEWRANHEIIDYQYNIKDRGTRQVVQGYTDKLQFISENIQNMLLFNMGITFVPSWKKLIGQQQHVV